MNGDLFFVKAGTLYTRQAWNKRSARILIPSAGNWSVRKEREIMYNSSKLNLSPDRKNLLKYHNKVRILFRIRNRKILLRYGDVEQPKYVAKEVEDMYYREVIQEYYDTSNL